MSEGSESKKGAGRWIGVIVVLLLILIFQAGWLIKLQMDSRSAAPKPAGPFVVRTARQAVSPAQTAVSSPAMDPFGWSTATPLDESWDPFREMEEMQRSMNRMFRESFSRGARHSALPPVLSYNPDLDVRETDTEYVIRLDLPGLDKDKISVKVQNGMLIVSGERSAESEETSQEGNFYRAERSFGSFARSFPLPADADADNMKAESKNGVLTVHIPKLPGKKPVSSTIPVQ